MADLPARLTKAGAGAAVGFGVSGPPGAGGRRPSPVVTAALERVGHRAVEFRRERAGWTLQQVASLARLTAREAAQRISWGMLRYQFGSDRADDPQGRWRFRNDFESHLARVLILYPAARVEAADGGPILPPSRPHVAARPQQELV